jgi:hypothetical protein
MAAVSPTAAAIVADMPADHAALTAADTPLRLREAELAASMAEAADSKAVAASMAEAADSKAAAAPTVVVAEAASMAVAVVAADSTAVVAVVAAPMVVEAADTGKINVGSSKKARLLRQAGFFRSGVIQHTNVVSVLHRLSPTRRDETWRPHPSDVFAFVRWVGVRRTP